jgi:CTP-dependent riboflavin kinase
MHHQFNETGVYCYKTGINQIGTIIVEPHKTIYPIAVFGDQLSK